MTAVFSFRISSAFFLTYLIAKLYFDLLNFLKSASCQLAFFHISCQRLDLSLYGLTYFFHPGIPRFPFTRCLGIAIKAHFFNISMIFPSVFIITSLFYNSDYFMIQEHPTYLNALDENLKVLYSYQYLWMKLFPSQRLAV